MSIHILNLTTHDKKVRIGAGKDWENCWEDNKKKHWEGSAVVN